MVGRPSEPVPCLVSLVLMSVNDVALVRQFERDMRALVSFFVSHSNSSVRSKLTRLVQLSKLLSLDSPQELLDYWGTNEGPVPWEFNGSEAKRWLGTYSVTRSSGQ